MNVLQEARELDWYQSVELAPGQVTEGVFDHRPFVERYRLPANMEGLRALDVGTFDGFWAFELERRGAEVVAIDVDWDRDLDWPPWRRPETFPDSPRGPSFELAKRALGSDVERRNLSVYDATPDELGMFDVVLCGSILTHLRDQILALERIAALCRDLFVCVETYHRGLSLLPLALARYRGAAMDPAPVFWVPNVRGWRRLIESVGFSRVEVRDRFQLRAREGWSVPHLVLHARK